MLSGITLLLVLLLGTWTGDATCYAPLIFQKVWEYRSTYLAPCPECVGYAALADPKYTGSKIWVSDGLHFIGPLHVIDNGVFHTPGRIVELDAETCAAWGMRAPRRVTVQFYPWLWQYPRDWVPPRIQMEN